MVWVSADIAEHRIRLVKRNVLMWALFALLVITAVLMQAGLVPSTFADPLQRTTAQGLSAGVPKSWSVLDSSQPNVIEAVPDATPAVNAALLIQIDTPQGMVGRFMQEQNTRVYETYPADVGGAEGRIRALSRFRPRIPLLGESDASGPVFGIEATRQLADGREVLIMLERRLGERAKWDLQSDLLLVARVAESVRIED